MIINKKRLKERKIPRDSAKSDVCLILEGTYPYVAGGVSTWVHDLIAALPDISFSLIHLSSSADEVQELKYPLPNNIQGMVNIYIHDDKIPYQKRKGNKKYAWEEIANFHQDLKDNNLERFDQLFRILCLPEGRVLNTHDLVFSKNSWNLLVDLYHERAADSSFIDYFWTWRFTHLPLFQLMEAIIPRAAVYHTVCTGYAGLLGVIAKKNYNAPLILTEHGIYAKERKIEISQAEWIYVKGEGEMKALRTPGLFKLWWINKFNFLSRLTYKYADEIITLYEGNQIQQIADGADPSKVSIIPNGINTSLLSKLKEGPQSQDGVFRVGFMGRVVPIKDVKTFIRACKIVADRIPKLEVYIMGPTDEDEEYYQDCINLTQLLGLQKIIRFCGRVDVKEYYPRLDLIVLTSISEAQPLVILEANCVGIPAVASDVGACSELLYGRTEEDKRLGQSGIVTGVANPRETAEAIIKIWQDESLRKKMMKAGKERVNKYYSQDDLNEKYREMYRSYKELGMKGD